MRREGTGSKPQDDITHNKPKIKAKKHCSSVPEVPGLLKTGEVLPVCSHKGESPVSPGEHFSSAQVSLQ